MAQDFDVTVERGRLRARRFGHPGATPALCIPGLSSNSRAFDALGESIASRGGEAIAFDLRGRGWSDITASGTYGWERHARDILEAADALGIRSFDLVGHSMGAYIGMVAASLDRDHRIQRLVLVDAAGIPTMSSLRAIGAGVQRLNETFADADAYVAAVRAAGLVTPWNAYWERHYRYDLVASGGVVASRTAYAAIAEDSAYGATHNPRVLWPKVTVPTLLLRAAVPLGPASDGYVLTRADYTAFLSRHPGRRGAEIAENHFGILCAPAACAEIVTFLARDAEAVA
mgnify:CR=1 FL=1